MIITSTNSIENATVEIVKYSLKNKVSVRD